MPRGLLGRLGAGSSIRLVVVGALCLALGAGLIRLSPAAKASSLQTRSWSCQALGWTPEHSNSGPEHSPGALMLFSDTTSYYFCDAVIPNGAIVTRVQFTVFDNYSAEELRYCALVRSGMGAKAGNSYAIVAQAASTGYAAKPGRVRLSPSVHAGNAAVDNSKYAYFLQCQFNFDPPNAIAPTVEPAAQAINQVGLWGATITYQVSPANG